MKLINRKFKSSVIAIGLLLSAVGVSYSQNGVKKEVMDTLTKFVDRAEQEMEEIDKTSSNKTILTKQLPYESSSKKTTVTVDVRNGIVRKLSYFSYDESFTTTAKEMYYFDSKGVLISHVNKPTGSLTHVIFSSPYVMIYSRVGNKLTDNSLFVDDEAYLLLAKAKYTVDYYLSNFTGVKYCTFNVDRNESFIVKTVVATDMHITADFKSPVLKKLPKGYGLLYLERSEKQDSLPGKQKWVWLKVRDEKKVTGWIWGHPSIIKGY